MTLLTKPDFILARNAQKILLKIWGTEDNDTEMIASISPLSAEITSLLIIASFFTSY